jgi:hypothetical protein
MPMETTIRSGFITDLIVPRAGTCGKSATELDQIAFDTAVELLHDHPSFIQSNPLVQGCEKIHAQHPKYIDVHQFHMDFGVPEHSERVVGPYVQYEIEDKLNLIFGYTQQLIYHSALRRTTSGFESFTNPGSGVKIHGTFDIQRSPESPGVINFVEHNETKCNVLLSMYIKATNSKAHREMHENFKKAWNEKMKEKLGGEEQGKQGGKPVVPS